MWYLIFLRVTSKTYWQSEPLIPQAFRGRLNESYNGSETLEGTHHILKFLLNRVKLPHNGRLQGKEQVSLPITIINCAPISCEKPSAPISCE